MAVPEDAVAPNQHYVTPATRRKVLPAAGPPAGAQAGTFAAPFTTAVRGLSRVANTAEYRLYGENGVDPVPGVSTVRATGSALPLTWVPGDGDWRIGVTYFNGYLESGFLHVDRIRIASGTQAANGPSNPQDDWHLEQRAAGVARINAMYFGRADSTKATHWKIWYTTNGSDPDVTAAATVTSAMTFLDPAGEWSRLAYDLPAQANGTTIKAIVRAFITSTSAYSTNTEIKSTTADATGPAAPADIETWRGPLPEGLA